MKNLFHYFKMENLGCHAKSNTFIPVTFQFLSSEEPT